MKQQGIFSVCLVNNETGEVFQEYNNGRKCYAEVEPDLEYIVRLGNDSNETVYVDIEIDGKLIEKKKKIKPHQYEDVGIWVRKRGVNVNTPLKFDKVRCRELGEKNGHFPYSTGVVKAVFYAKSENTTEIPKHLIYPMQRYDVSRYVGYCKGGDEKGEKRVKSVCGETELSTIPVRPATERVTEVDLLATFELNYCSTVGLIRAKILPETPEWRLERLRKHRVYSRTDNWKELSEAKVKKVKLDRVVRDGIVVQQGKEIDMFDLTEETM